MSEKLREHIERFVRQCHRIAGFGLVRCSSGNVSARLDDQTMLVTATGSWMADITPGQVSRVRIADGEILQGPAPSIESGFHAGVFQARPDVNVVLHFQSPAATALACCDGPEPNFDIILEVPFYIGPVARVPFLMPGSAELARAVISSTIGHDMVMLKNHGLVTVGGDFNQTIQRAVFFELACEIILRAEGGRRTVPMEDKIVAELRGLADQDNQTV
jgi:ribulose-5-phosphate 4-epimerase/fuculose-1-phosphate aldolase